MFTLSTFVTKKYSLLSIKIIGIKDLFSPFANYYIRNDSYGDTDESEIHGTPWTKVAADFKYIDAGVNFLWACDNDDNVWMHYIDQDIHMGE